MFHTKLFAVPLFALLLVTLAGCASRTIPTGMYLPERGGDEYAVIYNNMIFLHVERPENMVGQTTYWDWAGNYELSETGEISFDMDKKDQKDWNFFYTFRADPRGGIFVEYLNDTTKSYRLKRRPIQRRPQPESAENELSYTK